MRNCYAMQIKLFVSSMKLKLLCYKLKSGIIGPPTRSNRESFNKLGARNHRVDPQYCWIWKILYEKIEAQIPKSWKFMPERVKVKEVLKIFFVCAANMQWKEIFDWNCFFQITKFSVVIYLLYIMITSL